MASGKFERPITKLCLLEEALKENEVKGEHHSPSERVPDATGTASCEGESSHTKWQRGNATQHRDSSVCNKDPCTPDISNDVQITEFDKGGGSEGQPICSGNVNAPRRSNRKRNEPKMVDFVKY